MAHELVDPNACDGTKGKTITSLAYTWGTMKGKSWKIAIGLSLLAVTSLASTSLFQEAVAKSPAEVKPLKVGDRVPKVSLKDLEGKDVKLTALAQGAPSVLVFYRGGWCPFCNAHLAELGKIEGDLRGRGYQIIAISPDLPAELSKTADKDHLTYKLLSDSSAEAMKKFGVAFRLDDETFTMYRDRFKIDLEKSSGQVHHILPVPSVFVVNKEGVITFVHSNLDYKVRLKGEEILKAVDNKG